MLISCESSDTPLDALRRSEGNWRGETSRRTEAAYSEQPLLPLGSGLLTGQDKLTAAEVQSLARDAGTHDFIEYFRRDGVDDEPPLFTGLHQPGILQHGEMVSHVQSGNVRPFDDLRDVAFAIGQQPDNAEPFGSRQGRQHFGTAFGLQGVASSGHRMTLA